MNLATGTNPRGRLITYSVRDPRTGMPLFEFQAGRFSRKMLLREARKHGIALPLKVFWTTANRWGFDSHARLVEA